MDKIIDSLHEFRHAYNHKNLTEAIAALNKMGYSDDEALELLSKISKNHDTNQ